MSKRMTLALGFGMAVMLLATAFAGQALAQQAGPARGNMMGSNSGMMARTSVK
jgi:hypothetical protein